LRIVTENGVRRLSVAGLQLELAKAGNIALLGEEIRSVKKRFPWLDMVVLSELSAHGTSTERAERLPGPSEEEFSRFARDNGVWLVAGSLFERDGARVFNTTPVINPAGEIVARYRKMFPFYPYEEGVTAGESFCVFDVPNVGRIGISNCYDVWFPEHARTLSWMGAEMIVNPSLTNTIDRDVELSLVRAAATSNQCYVFNVNGAGMLGYGRSIVCGPGGEILHQAGTGREIVVLDLDMDVVADVRERGWNGLGQVLKSFRDRSNVYPPYREGARSKTLDALGPLVKPSKERT
jgi:deaminated glutathione amidase